MQLESREIGNYRIISQIGYGASGYVYLAEDPRIQQRVAMKVIQIEPGGDLTQFRSEARIVAQLKHPHIVHLNAYDEAVIDEMAIIYFVTPYYKDGSLAQWIQQRGTDRLPVDDVLYLISQGADALKYAHTFQVVHGDVKPSNFLIDTEGIPSPNRPNLLLTDFGVARFTASSPTRAGLSYPGGLTYIAPEQVNGQSSAASDQYSLAIIAYELLTGQPPFLGTPPNVIRQHLETPPDPPSTKNSSIPKAIDDVILRALAKKPEDRWGSVEAFSTALQRKSGVVEPPRKPPFPPLDDQPRSPNPPPPPPRDPNPPPPPNQLSGNDAYTTLLVSPAEAQAGAVKQLMLRGRSVTVRVPPNTYNGMVMHIDGLGEPSPTGGQPGKLHLTVNIAPQPYQSPPQGPAYQPRGYQAPPPPPPSAYQSPPGQVMMPSPGQHNPNRTLWIVLAVIAIILVLSICVIAGSYHGY